MSKSGDCNHNILIDSQTVVRFLHDLNRSSLVLHVGSCADKYSGQNKLIVLSCIEHSNAGHILCMTRGGDKEVLI